MRKGAGKGPPGFGCGEGTLAVNSVVGVLALVPANNHLPTPTHTSATTHRPHPAPASVAPRTPVRQSCPAACCQRATPPPAGHARRPETRQAPRARAARTCLRWRRSWCRSHGACRCPMRPRTCHPMQSTPPSPRNRARRTPLTPSVLARRTPPRSRPLPPAAASRVQAASAACLLSLPHTRPRAARTCLRWLRPLRLARAASRRTTRPCRSQWQTCACPCPAAASPFLPTVRDEFARG